MKTRTLLVGVILTVIVQTGNFALYADKASDSRIEKVLGAWEIVENWSKHSRAGVTDTQNVQPSLFIFTNNYYSIAYVNGDESRPLMPEGSVRGDLTPEQIHSQWRMYVSNSGTCEISSTQITTRPKVALMARFMQEGSVRVFNYKFEGDLLLLTVTEEDFSWKLKLKRLP